MNICEGQGLLSLGWRSGDDELHRNNYCKYCDYLQIFHFLSHLFVRCPRFFIARKRRLTVSQQQVNLILKITKAQCSVPLSMRESAI